MSATKVIQKFFNNFKEVEEEEEKIEGKEDKPEEKKKSKKKCKDDSVCLPLERFPQSHNLFDVVEKRTSNFMIIHTSTFDELYKSTVIQVPSFKKDLFEKYTKDPLCIIFSDPNLKEYKGIAQVESIGDQAKFQLNINVKWMELTKLSFEVTSSKILIDTNQTLNLCKNFTILPWNIGMDLCTLCI